MMTASLILIGVIALATTGFVLVARSGGKPLDRRSGADGTGTTSGINASSDSGGCDAGGGGDCGGGD